MIAYSSVPGEGYLSDKGVEKMRSAFAKDIFAQDMHHIYEQQTQYRDQLREQGRVSAAEIVAQINSETYRNSRVEALLVDLSVSWCGKQEKRCGIWCRPWQRVS